jgi:O-antigen ligase
LFLGHGFFLSLVMVLPLMRNAWDPWAQTLVLGAWAFWILLGGVLVWRRGARFPPLENALRTRGPLWGAILALGLISMVFSVYPHSAVPGALGDFSTAAFFFLGAGLSREKRPLYRRALAGAGALAGVAALVLNGVRSPAVGVAVNPNALAALALLSFPVAVGLWRSAAKTRGAWAWGAVVAVLVITTALSRSLWALVVLGAQIFFLWFALNERKRRRFWAALAGIGAAAVIGGIFLDRADWVKFAGDPDRWAWWRTAWNMIRIHPGVGVGPGAFGEAYPLFRARDGGLNSLYAHNGFLEWVAERGILGGGLLIAWAVGAVRTAGRGTSAVDRCLGASLAGFLLFNVVHIGFSFPALMWLFALTAGLAVPVAGDGTVGSPAFPRRAALVGSAAGVAVFAASFSLFRAGQMLERGRSAFFQNESEAARAWAERGLRWNPRSPELHALRAGALFRSGDREGAIAGLNEAVRRAPGAAGFRMDRAELFLAVDRPADALEDYAAVNQRLPLFFPAWERRGDLLARAGRKEEARDAYANGLTALDNPRSSARGQNKGVARERLETKIKGLPSRAPH